MSESESTARTGHRGRVGLLVTCLVDAFRPAIGFATASLLEKAGYLVEVPSQGCCGQPNFNGGDMAGSQQMALRMIRHFSGYDYVVVPSGSCAAMVRIHYPELFAEGTSERRAADGLAERTWELTMFLHEIAHFEVTDAEFACDFAMHDACSGLRELGIREQPRALLAGVSGCREQKLANPDVCCGFGGLFCSKYPDISNRMAQKKIADLLTTDQPVEALVSGDLGCLMHLAGKMHRDGIEIDAWHIAEVLDGRSQATSGAKEP